MRLALGLLVAAIGCIDRTSHALLICHNANCVEGATLDDDDTIDALRGSLALRTAEDRVTFDGMEIDSVWSRALGRCTFSHLPDAAAPDLAEATRLVAAHVRGSRPGAAAHNGAAFYFKIELKTDVGDGNAHTPAEVAAHVACVTAAARAVVAAGVASDNDVIPIFDSDDPALLAAIDPAPFARAHPGCLFETGWAVPLPSGFAPQILTVGWYEDPPGLALDRSAARLGVDELGAPNGGGIAIWARSPKISDLYAMLVRQPAYLAVNNVEVARALMDQPLP